MKPDDSPAPDSGDSRPGDQHDARTVEALSPDLPAQSRVEPSTHANPPALRLTPGEPATLPEVSRVERPAAVFELAGYEILGEIAQGGMGVVYKARQLSLDRLVALKCLPPSVQSDPDRLHRFQIEATAAAKLTKHGILPVYDVLDAGGAPVLVMPYIEGSDLAHIIADRIAVRDGKAAAAERHPWASLSDEAYLERILSLLDRVIDALVLLHQVNVLHRDIKPSNILVDTHGDAWLADFGLARFGNQPGTLWAETVGTPGYMSPEQWDGRHDIDGRADVFSLGVAAYQALTLELPYGRNRVTTATRMKQTPSQLNPLVAERLGTVIEKAITPDRSARYQSAADLKQDWVHARQVAVLEPAAPPLLWRRLAFFGALLALPLLAGIVGYIAVPRNVPDSNPEPEMPPPKLSVVVKTEPAGAEVVFVPLHPDTGEPEPERAVHPPDETRTPLRIDLAPGLYFVEAQTPDHRFHQVYRRVPLPGQPRAHAQTRWLRQENWKPLEDGVIELPTISIPAGDRFATMVRCEGAKEFRMGNEKIDSPAHTRLVAPYLLDAHEVTEGEFRAAMGELPKNLEARGDNYAVTQVSYLLALECAELLGKRLPTEAEYEWAATAGGTQKFPWGDRIDWLNAWPFLPVGQPADDRTPKEPPIFGLFSNVAEWTSSWPLSYPGITGPLPPDHRNMRMVRGGAYSVVMMNPKEQEWLWGPRFRHAVSLDREYPGLGFRCARSVQPLYLNRH